jgi:3-dehydroquinate dehydratase/shikimate dehydrogenase
MKKSLICLAITERTLRDGVKAIARYRNHIDCAELRADYLAPEELAHCNKFPKMAGLPTIFTLRKPRDGGRYDGTERERISLVKQALGGGYAFADLEEDLDAPGLDAEVESSGCRIIRSIHDFKGVPFNLPETIRRIPRSGREIPKVAVTPVSAGDLLRLFRVMREVKQLEKIILGMGATGFPTRVLAPRFGSFLTYTSVPGKIAAPGHIDPETLDTLYGFRSIGESTALYGIAGFPLAHSRSPIIHNRGFRALGLDAVYCAFPTDDIDGFFDIARLLALKGISVTIPYKEKAIRFAIGVEDSVREAGACNTLVQRDEGFFGFNTDIDGFLAPLRRGFAGTIPPGLRATVVGAGGAGKACVYGLVREGAKVLIVNRTGEKARELAERYGCAWGSLGAGCEDLIAGYNDLIVQTTSAGMEPNAGEDPLAFYCFKGTEVAYDIVYKPPMTAFLSRAQKAGCRLIMGKEMLREQAYIQFRLFTGREYPDELKNDPDLV